MDRCPEPAPRRSVLVMRLLRGVLVPGVAAAAVLALWGDPAWANATGVYTIPFTASVVVQQSNGSCSTGPESGTGLTNQDIATNNTQYQTALGGVGAGGAIPAGATVLSETASGTATLVVGGYNTTYGFEIADATPAPPWPSSGACQGEVNTPNIAWISFPSSSGVGFTVNNAGIFQTWGAGGTLYGGARTWTAGSSWVVQIPALMVQAQYGFEPSGLAIAQDYSGAGLDATLSWNPNGNDGGTVYTLQRETLGPGGVIQGFTTIYQGTATSFNTAGTGYAQGCGLGYRYSVAVVGSEGTTPWDTTPEWDEYPCSVSFSGATPTSITVSWPEVTGATVPRILWCEEDTPGGGVSCSQSAAVLSTGQTSVTLTGLVPNAEYAVWACSQSNAWGCPDTNNWTYAATPTLSAGGGGSPYYSQVMNWTTAGNAPGTTYQLQQGTFDQSGTWQGGTLIYDGTGATFTASQAPGISYAYNVWALSYGYGTLSSLGNDVSTQVASVPTATVTGTTTLTVSWPVVAYMATTGVACEIDGSGNWVSYGPATGGATSLPVTGLLPNSAYYCVTYAEASNAGFQWWVGANIATTDVDPPGTPYATAIGQTSFTLNWGADGNPAGTLYHYNYEVGGAWATESATTATSVVIGGLVCGTQVQETAVRAESGSGGWTAWSYGAPVPMVPYTPALTEGDGGLGWSPSSGRGYVTLSWPAVTGATGYTVWVYEGWSYESFNVGTSTSWDSRTALIYPPDASLYANVASGSGSPPVLIHNGGGLNLRDLPNDLYCTTEVRGSGWGC